MAEKFYTLLTEIGKAKIANSAGFGSKINFVKMKVGDGGGSYYNPREDQEDLINTVWEGNITHVAIDEKNPNWINVEMMIPANVGGFMIREYGVFDEDNNMLAIAKCAESYKPLAEDGSTKELIMKMVLTVSNTENITLKIDPTIIFAKKSEIEILENKIKNIKIPVTSVNSKTGAIELKAEDIKTNSGESVELQLVDITTDTKRLTNAKDITGAINELFTNANNGKKLISDVVGNPLLATDTFQQQNDKIQSLKNALVSNLNVKGQVSSNAESLKSLIDKVLNINTGRKSASGKQDQKNLINGIILEVSDLDFKPSIIFLYVSCHTSYYIAYSNSSVSYRYCHSDQTYPYYSTSFPLSIKPDGFRYEHLNTNFWDISWLAIE
ncbi:phage tail protein [Clostridium botulinum]|uniref:phage tail protein n=1 Tax=Clostridium botulinum TaxID=1491 RepID=UPI00035BAF6A|nr:phage tail protein [Clostridium botulinum]AJD27295.1 phage tail-collar fiber family protein [Clostridium botulinum CDC_297]EPS50132.1 tail fiber protein [Clostridium botulinum A1 str. CFSAN002368]MBY6878375.1 phage tail protein [Clostridium botulinum]MBY6892055.1 phage tail protein [Clostridium botulinum]MBY6894489.1 phage tail protein [Clostridium botulinum]